MVVLAGAAALFATYWDEAWHTDIGRDSAWAAPHVLLYGSVAAVGLSVALWGAGAVLRTRSVTTALRARPLVLAGAAGLAVLAAAPIDSIWHSRFGRDAVAWSPPHLLVLLGSIALLLGVLAGVARSQVRLRVALCVLVLADAVALVFEYEGDVPQFSETFYLPVLIAAGLLGALVARGSVELPAPVTVVVLGYALLRVLIGSGLLLLGRSTPDLPIAVLGLAALDLPFKSLWQRLGAAIGATSVLAWTASALELASPAPAAVAVMAIPAAAVGAAMLLAPARWPRSLGASAVLLGLAALPLAVPTEPAQAHDPGQGRFVAEAAVTARTDGDGIVELTVAATSHCADLDPVRVVARRAGEDVTGQLRRDGSCTYRGSAALPSPGRWFVYAEFLHDGEAVEAWVPLFPDQEETVEATRTLYRPPPAGDGVSVEQIGWGALVYLLGLALLGFGVALTIRDGREHLRHA